MFNYSIFFQVEAYGRERMKADVEKLENLNSEVIGKCVVSATDQEHMPAKSLYRPFSHEVVAFKVK